MEDNVEINVYSTNKQSTEQICQKCIDYLMEDKNKAVKLIARSNAIPKVISISEMVKSKLPHITQINNLLNLDDQSEKRRKNVKMTIILLKKCD